MKRILFNIFIAISILSLISCDKKTAGGDEGKGVRPSGKVSGVAQLGSITDGIIKVYRLESSGRTTELSSSTISNSTYQASLVSASTPVVACLSSATYIEESTGTGVAFAPINELCGVANYSSGVDLKLSITFYSHIAYGLTKYLISTGVSPAIAVKDANKRISAWLGVDITTVEPKNITDNANSSTFLSDSLALGFENAAVSSFTEWVSVIKNNESIPHQNYNSINFATTAFDDIQRDGKLDGIGTIGQLSLGNVVLNANIYRHNLALNIIAIANDTARNATSLTPDLLIGLSKAFNSTTDLIFEGSNVIDYSNDAPIFANQSIADNAIKTGIVKLSADITDVTGIKTVEFFIGSTSLGQASDLSNPSISIDTTDTNIVPSDGVYNFSIVAVNQLNITGTLLINSVTISNAGTSISKILPVDTSYIKNQFTMSATITDVLALTSIVFDIDGGSVQSPSDINAPSVTFDVSNLTGQHVFNITATNSASIVKTATVKYTVDNIPPVVTLNNVANNSYVKGNGTVINGTISDNIGLKSGTLFLSGSLLTTFTAFPDVSFTLDTLGGLVPDGVKTLVLNGTDNANSLIQDRRTITVDNTLPTGGITNQVANSFIGTDFTIDVSANDVTSGIAKVEAFIGATSLGLAADITAPSFTVLLSTITTEGAYTLKATITDKAGNFINHTIQNFYIDTANPAISANAPYQDLQPGQTCTVNFSVSDSGSGIADVKIDGESQGARSGNFSINLYVGTGATHSFSATDKAGRTTSGSIELWYGSSFANQYCQSL